LQPTRLTIDDRYVRALTNGKLVKKAAIPQGHIRPVVKWAGGKQWLAYAAETLAPGKWTGRYIEPFLGGGAFFFALRPRIAYLSDANHELIRTYEALRDDPDSVVDLLERYPYDEKFYYALRSKRPRTGAAVAARLIYLNKTCWNGLYRVNKRDEFNTPFGKYSNPSICEEEKLDEASAALGSAILRCCDFATALEGAKRRDFVYCDPPYITGHQNNGFLKYNAHLFDWEDQERLAEIARGLSLKGVNVLVSNADHEQVVRLYRGFYYYRLSRSTLISGTPDGRGLTAEALLSSYRLLDCESEVI
jgi:DNA adenine methylase